MAKVSKNQRVDRGKRDAATPMARLIISEKKGNGQYRFRKKMVRQSDVQDEIKKARASQR